MHPSTKRSATIGGFVAGGSGGIGSVTWGGLREPGNVTAARIVTVEAEPRVLELRDTAVQAVNHAYGTTGLITALEMPLAPAWHWIDLIVAFPTFMEAARFGHAVALADGVSIADPHVFTLEDGAGHERVDADQLGFKRHADPLGLMNPGKMRSFG